jgi:predicted aspartyl protease
MMATMRRAWARWIVGSMVTSLLAAAPASAQIFKWVDERGHAHYSQGLDSVPERHRATAVRLQFRERPAEPAPAPAAERAAVRSGGATIRYTPGQRIMVDVRLNGRASARLLLDTGADRTLISPRALAAAGVGLTRPIATGEMSGVTGTDRVAYVVVDSLEVGEARVARLPVAAYEMPRLEGDGLLGRDFLDQFTVSIDATRGLVTLAPK